MFKLWVRDQMQLHRAVLATLVVSACVLAASGCGGGSGGSGGGSGGLSFRAVWEQPSGGVAAAASPARQSSAAGQTGFGSGIPSTVKTVRLTFDADSGQHCCVAIDPTLVPQGVVVLQSLQAGGATFRISGFPTTFAPPLSGAVSQCVIEPAGAGQACDASRQAAPNFDSGPQRVVIVAGQETDAGEIPVPAVGTPTPVVSATPTPTPSPVETREPTTIIVRPPSSIASAARRAPAGSTIIAAPGVYPAIVLVAGDLEGPIFLIGDADGSLTESAPAPITVTAGGRSAALDLSAQADLTVDGFTFRGGTDAGVLVDGSAAISLLNCVVTANGGDGIRVTQSQDVLIFDSLVFGNPGAAIRVLETSGAEVINNTAYGNRDAGLRVNDAADIFVENNIFNQNTPLGIVVDPASITGYDANFNLNTDGYGDGTPAGVNDLTGPFSNPLFVTPQRGDFHLARGVAGSTSPAIDAGDPDTDPALVSILAERTVQSDGTLDSGAADLGYHYPPPIPTPPRGF